MIYLEMSRDEAHGGGEWAFPYCIWAPAEKAGGGSWPFWHKVCDVRRGDNYGRLSVRQKVIQFLEDSHSGVGVAYSGRS
jgi:hypothetical protein